MSVEHVDRAAERRLDRRLGLLALAVVELEGDFARGLGHADSYVHVREATAVRDGIPSVGVTLPTSPPSAHGVDAAGISGFLDAIAAAGIELHSIAIARHGHVIAEGWWAPYRADRVHLLYSLSKSLTATAVATLVADGAISLDDPVLDHLPVHGIDVDPRWNAVRVKHCLSMTVGHTEDAWLPVMMAVGAGDTSSFLAHVLRNGPDAEPGTVFCYNQVATYLLSRAVAHVTGPPPRRRAARAGARSARRR